MDHSHTASTSASACRTVKLNPLKQNDATTVIQHNTTRSTHLEVTLPSFLNPKVVNAFSQPPSSIKIPPHATFNIHFHFQTYQYHHPCNYFHLSHIYFPHANLRLLEQSIMAEADSNSLQQPLLTESEEEQRLKYLEFVQVASLHALMYAAKLYSYAKENSGPLKTGVDTVEGTVKTVVGPVYHKYQGVPVDLLKFVDRKVDESINKVQSRVPPTLKQVSTQAFEAAQKAPAAARSVVSEVKSSGLVGSASGLAQTMYAKYEPAAKDLAQTMYAKYEPAAKDLYTKYEPVAEQYAVTTWRSLNQLPLFPQVAQAVAPTASYYTQKYNEAVQQAADKGWQVASHLPMVPTEKIAKVFRNQESTVTVE